ncbi:hypothetical protein [Pseudomonas corrugata]|jgi:hypothetical protein|uniref:hypothetical protein n=1 Tax=Pseudomonas corrugata TaxID=47879 RepID=UPI003709616E
MQKVVDFYVKLGFVQVVSNEGYARFICPGSCATFSFSLVDGDIGNGAIIYFEHEQLDTWVDQLLEKEVFFDQIAY